jgi:hypothetical protein
MGQHSDLEIAAVHADRPAENLFFAQYRHWMAGYATGDIFCWDCAWDCLLKFVAQESAKALYSDFHLFVRALVEQTGRVPGWRPDVCRCLCRDEYLALMLVGAAQRGDAADERQVAAAFVGHDRAPAVVTASRRLAEALTFRRFILGPVKRRPAEAEMAQTLDRHKLH